MNLVEKMKNGELYDCSFDVILEDFNEKLYECKDIPSNIVTVGNPCHGIERN